MVMLIMIIITSNRIRGSERGKSYERRGGEEGCVITIEILLLLCLFALLAICFVA